MDCKATAAALLTRRCSSEEKLTGENVEKKMSNAQSYDSYLHVDDSAQKIVTDLDEPLLYFKNQNASETKAQETRGSNVLTEKQSLEEKILELKSILNNEEAFLIALNAELKSKYGQTAFGKEMSLLLTNSTEYHPLQDEFDVSQSVYTELFTRDSIISKLTESLQKSITVRKEIQKENEELTDQMQKLRQQLSENGNFKSFLENQHKNDVDKLRNENMKLKEQHKQETLSHSKEMENLRKYFEQKCSDLEKQFSDEVLSMKSQERFNESSSDSNCEFDDLENTAFTSMKFSHSSPRKRLRARLLQSPTYHPMTPTSDGFLPLQESKTFVASDENKQMVSKNVKILKKITRKKPKTRRSGRKRRNQKNLYKKAFLKLKNHLWKISRDDSCVITKITEEYDRRLQEQVQLARNDLTTELEQQIQTFSKTNLGDNDWPSSLLLLRENLKSKSQTQISQLQTKHQEKEEVEEEEEMSRLKLEEEVKVRRKNMRETTFDSFRHSYTQKLSAEFHRMRELSGTFRFILSQLLKCVVTYEDDLIETVIEEAKRLLLIPVDQSQTSSVLIDDEKSALFDYSLNTSLAQGTRLAPGIQQLQKLVDDKELVEYIDNKNFDCVDVINTDVQDGQDVDLQFCLAQLRIEASRLLELSKKICAERNLCEPQVQTTMAMALNSALPEELNISKKIISELQEIRTMFEKEEADRKNLRDQLEVTIERNEDLSKQMRSMDGWLSKWEESAGSMTHFVNENLHTSHMEEYVKDVDVPLALSNFLKLQEKAERLLPTLFNSCSHSHLMGHTEDVEITDKSSCTSAQQQSQIVERKEDAQKSIQASEVLLQLTEDFYYESHKILQFFKRDHEILQSQIDNADKQLKATRQFLEDQALEREQERDEYNRALLECHQQIRDKDMKLSNYAAITKEVERLQQQVTVQAERTAAAQLKNEKLEIDLKAALDKILMLRDIIVNLELEIDKKILDEGAFNKKIKHFEGIIETQNEVNATLREEMEKLKREINDVYQPRIQEQQEKLENDRPSSELSLMMQQITEQLRDIELCLSEKTKALEVLYNGSLSNSSSLSITEDVSANIKYNKKINDAEKLSNLEIQNNSQREHCVALGVLQSLIMQLETHNRAEEAAIKRIRDLEVHLKQTLKTNAELQKEQKKMLEEQNNKNQKTMLSVRIDSLLQEIKHEQIQLKAENKQQLKNFNYLIEKLQAIFKVNVLVAKNQNQNQNISNEKNVEIEQLKCEIMTLQEQQKNHICSSSCIIDTLPYEPGKPEAVRRISSAHLELQTANSMTVCKLDQAADSQFARFAEMAHNSTSMYTNILQPTQLRASINSTLNLMPRKINFSSFSDESKSKTQDPYAEQMQISEKLVDLETQLSAKTRKIEELEENLRKSNEEISFYRETLESKEQEILSLKNEVNENHIQLYELLLKYENSVADAQTKEKGLCALESNVAVLKQQIAALKTSITQAEQQKQQYSDNSSKQFSVDEIARKVEKELNYSVQLDSNILKAIESEEENMQHDEGGNEHVESIQELKEKIQTLQAELYEAAEFNMQMRITLLSEQQKAKETQAQDVSIIEQMRQRLELALEDRERLVNMNEEQRQRLDDLQKQLNATAIESVVCECAKKLSKYINENSLLRLTTRYMKEEIEKHRNAHEEYMHKFEKIVKLLREKEEAQEREKREVANMQLIKLEQADAELEKNSIELLKEKFDEREQELVSSIANLENRLENVYRLYKREESYRKSLIYQKYYLTVMEETRKKSMKKFLRKYDVNEQKIRVNRLKCIVFSIIAIKRMQFIVHTRRNGKRTSLILTTAT